LTLVDNRKQIVFNGSDLGKGYSGQALMKRFDIKSNVLMASEKERHALTPQGSEFPQLQFRDLALPTLIQDIAKEFLNVMKAEKSGEEPINPHHKNKKKTRKKRKRGLRL
jgi:hypothetical protein